MGRSMVAFHPFSIAREFVLAMWAPARQAPDIRLTELFVLHGMLFTNIQLDDFKRIMERFQGKFLGRKFMGAVTVKLRS